MVQFPPTSKTDWCLNLMIKNYYQERLPQDKLHTYFYKPLPQMSLIVINYIWQHSEYWERKKKIMH